MNFKSFGKKSRFIVNKSLAILGDELKNPIHGNHLYKGFRLLNI